MSWHVCRSNLGHSTTLYWQEDDYEDVYEYVDEEEYTKRTNAQANTDFVVDDGVFMLVKRGEQLTAAERISIAE